MSVTSVQLPRRSVWPVGALAADNGVGDLLHPQVSALAVVSAAQDAQQGVLRPLRSCARTSPGLLREA